MESGNTSLVLVAAGSGTRMSSDKNKILMEHGGKPLFLLALEAFADSGAVDDAVIVIKPQEREAVLPHLTGVSLPVVLANGGKSRQDSVYLGLCALPKATAYVMVHDSARPFVSPNTIKECGRVLKSTGSAVAGVFSKDTIKRVEEGRIVQTLDRESLVQIQTPQCFLKETLLKAHRAAQAEGFIGTDDSVLVERLGLPVHFVAGEYDNIKVTTPHDLPQEQTQLRIGHGMDVHAFAEGRPLVLGGETIAHPFGLAGHSDADVVVHAVMDALLGAAGLPDIGQQFPDTDPAFRGADSIGLLKKVADLLSGLGFSVANIDATLAMQAPKVGPHIPAMRRNIAKALACAPERVNIKATTTEGLGFIGRMEGAACHAVCLLEKAPFAGI